MAAGPKLMNKKLEISEIIKWKKFHFYLIYL